MLCDGQPRANLAYLPTPLEEVPRLTAAVGGPRLLVKRDDRSGLTFGGNKPRIFEYVFGQALAQGCDVMITSAGVQSNQLREATAAANHLGLRSVIVVCGATGREAVQGNLLLFHLLGADIRYFPHSDFRHPELFALLDEIKAEFEGRGHRPYIVHFSYEPGTLGSLAHVNAGEELAAQFREQGVSPDALVVPVGSGVTMSGFVLAFKHLGVPTRVRGIALIRPADVVGPELVGYANAAAERLGLSTRIGLEDFDLLDEYLPPGYGVMTPQIREAVHLAAGSEGLLLDPTYNGKALAAIMDQARSGRLTADHTVVLLHTGGVPALFAYHDKLLGE